MKETLAPRLRCPACGAVGLTPEATEPDAREIRSGTLRCVPCGQTYPIRDGIVDLLTGFSGSEIQEEQKFNDHDTYSPEEAKIFLNDDYLLGLPDGGYHPKMPNHWKYNALNFADIVDRAALPPGSRILDLGTGTCWTTRELTRRGYHCVAVDIAPERYTGLGCGDLYFETEGLHFERVLGDLSNPPFAPESFDGVFANAAVHHVSDLPGTFAHFARLIRPGGVVALANEPVGGIYKKIFKGEVMEEALEAGANEHIYSVFAWIGAARRAGLEPDVYLPRESTRLKFAKTAALKTLMQTPVLDTLAWLALRALLWPVLLLRGFGINLLFRKPA